MSYTDETSSDDEDAETVVIPPSLPARVPPSTCNQPTRVNTQNSTPAGKTVPIQLEPQNSINPMNNPVEETINPLLSRIMPTGFRTSQTHQLMKTQDCIANGVRPIIRLTTFLAHLLKSFQSQHLSTGTKLPRPLLSLYSTPSFPLPTCHDSLWSSPSSVPTISWSADVALPNVLQLILIYLNSRLKPKKKAKWLYT